MKCDKCAKKATVHLTEIVEGKVMEMHMCEDCAREQSHQMEQQFGLADLLAGLTDFGKQIPEAQKDVLKCPTCGLTYEEFRKFGRFGCAECYVAFKSQLKPLLKKIHGSTAHLGKKPVNVVETSMPAAAVPVSAGIQPPKAAPVPLTQLNAIDALRERLQDAISREDFEQAAELRDKIREMEEKG
ncbi:MAG: UvrB/UvrC motif-containing protein [Candidatus Omnitrophica bacterium]|nr:UvrB/UvrC motif-containing protein [Candidatus Omnitrophota bacterium]